jgi:hypothetical protein
VTTNYILPELAALMMNPLQLPHSLRVEILATIRTARWIDVVHVDEQLDRRTSEFMATRGDKRYGLVD